MRLKLTASAGGKTLVPYPVTVLADHFAISVYGDESGLLSRIEATTQLQHLGEDLPSFTRTLSGPVKGHVRVPRSDTDEVLVEILQFIESLGSFWIGIRSINWQEAEREWIPETDEDRAELSLFSHKVSAKYEERPHLFDPGMLRSIIENRGELEKFVLPLAFVRDGINEYKRMRYISAFYNFYFYLEDLYAEGKWRTRQVKERFLTSAHLGEVAKAAVLSFSKASQQRERESLEESLIEHGLAFSAAGLLELVVEMRGRLHHFSQRSSKVQGHPLNQHNFKALAYLTMQFCMSSYPMIVRDGEPR